MIRNIRRIIKFIILILLVTVIIFLANETANKAAQPYSHIYPDYKKIDITGILDKTTYTADDYKVLFYQTGLGKCAIDELVKSNEGKQKIIRIQEAFFSKVNPLQVSITPFTIEEINVDKYKNKEMSTEIGYFDNGYILVTRATCTFGWRHGHASIVINKENGYILESAVLGEPSQISNIKKFQYYPNFIILKLKDTSQNKLNLIADYALNNMSDIPYRLSSGIILPKYSKESAPLGTHCSHLVWYPFMHYGFDIDSDGGRIVTPKDIANSDLLEVVQFFGFDPDELWK